MRFKTLAIVGIILLGTVTLSVYSSYNKESAQTDGDIFQKK